MPKQVQNIPATVHFSPDAASRSCVTTTSFSVAFGRYYNLLMCIASWLSYSYREARETVFGNSYDLFVHRCRIACIGPHSFNVELNKSKANKTDHLIHCFRLFNTSALACYWVSMPESGSASKRVSSALSYSKLVTPVPMTMVRKVSQWVRKAQKEWMNEWYSSWVIE